MAGFEGFVGAFRRRVMETPRRTAVRFCAGEDREELSYEALDAAARSVARWLADRAEPGDRALLSFFPGTGFIQAFLGCLYAGVVPVPVPAQGGHSQQEARTDGIAADSGARLVLAEETLAEALTADGRDLEPFAADAGTLAFLQYTSGSTSDPKGVMVPHGALVHNIGLMRRSHGWHSGMTWCSWLPAYHDMGLIAMMLTPLHLGGTAVLMSPTEFLKRPVSWLRLIDQYGADVSCAPNFAYDLCSRLLSDEQIAGLDLSRWRYACNGAEPVDAGTLARFAKRFAPAGFRTEALLPGYGMAETTLYVSGTRADSAPVVLRVSADGLAAGSLTPAEPGEPAQDLVSSGIVRDLDVRIVDPGTARELPDGQVGEIWIRGDSVAHGYWRRPEQTAQAFGAVTASGEGGFLRTGDLGALDAGELYVTGRLKEMIIVHGRNLYPHDIEREVRALDKAFAELPAAVFSVRPGAHEEIVVVQELRARGLGADELRALARGAKSRLSAVLGVRVGGIVLVRVGQVRRTTSGKIQRTRMRQLFEQGGLAPVHAELDAQLAAAFAQPAASAPLPATNREAVHR
ncbi:fatty acyl-AMP ligase [Streptomyces sp. AP-93]|uniref:fatty acyl-AMP ligase n=1 Tax=Streptomyces sp. AP-93 TaxID=2929048 RepID=UPI0035ADF0D9